MHRNTERPPHYHLGLDRRVGSDIDLAAALDALGPDNDALIPADQVAALAAVRCRPRNKTWRDITIERQAAAGEEDQSVPGWDQGA